MKMCKIKIWITGYITGAQVYWRLAFALSDGINNTGHLVVLDQDSAPYGYTGLGTA